MRTDSCWVIRQVQSVGNDLKLTLPQREDSQTKLTAKHITSATALASRITEPPTTMFLALSTVHDAEQFQFPTATHRRGRHRFHTELLPPIRSETVPTAHRRTVT